MTRSYKWFSKAGWLGMGLAALLLVIAGLVACGSPSTQSPAASSGKAPGAAVQGQKVSVEGGAYTNISPAELASMLKAKDFSLVNVHVPYEGEIEPTDLFIPYTEIQQQVSKLPSNKSAKIVLYCRSGNMSDIAGKALVKLGYTNVYNLNGGMIAWKGAGHPIAEKKR